MRRAAAAVALLMAGMGAVLAQDRAIPPTPAALRDYRGPLHGTVRAVMRQREFTGLLVQLAYVEAPASGRLNAPEVPLGVVVAVAVAVDRNGDVLPELARVLDELKPGMPVALEVSASGTRRTLYARRIKHLAPAPGPPPVEPADAARVQALSTELHGLQQELARLQREVAELKALTQDLRHRARRLP